MVHRVAKDCNKVKNKTSNTGFIIKKMFHLKHEKSMVIISSSVFFQEGEGFITVGIFESEIWKTYFSYYWGERGYPCNFMLNHNAT